MPTTLTAAALPAYLRSRGASSEPDHRWTVSRLTGGVSGTVLSASDGAERWIVKQSLERLDVEDEWTAPADRILTEGRVMRLLSAMVPARSPAVLDVDDEMLTITLEHAPLDWTEWRSELLAGRADADFAGELGATLALLHVESARRAWSLPPDDGAEGLRMLRIDPFHRTVAERQPELADRVLAVAARTLAEHRCLVHGDFSPKNVLVQPGAGGTRRFWIIDGEVGHRGSPTFDVAFLLSHLALKRIAARERSMVVSLDLAAAAFVSRYVEAGGDVDSVDLSEQVGCLLLARVHGRSPVRYLSEPQRHTAATLGRAMLIDPCRLQLDRPLSVDDDTKE